MIKIRFNPTVGPAGENDGILSIKCERYSIYATYPKSGMFSNFIRKRKLCKLITELNERCKYCNEKCF